MRRNSADRFVDQLEAQALLKPSLVVAIRKQIAARKSGIVAELIAKSLVEKGHLAKFQADRILEVVKDEMRTHTTRFVEQVKSRRLVEAKVIDELCQLIWNKPEMTPELIAKFLVDFGHLTNAQASELLAVEDDDLQTTTPTSQSENSKLLLIRFSCPNCSTMFKVKHVTAGKEVSCSKCKTRIEVPHPGQNWLRKRCSECGTEHDFRHELVCDACSALAAAQVLWCTLHRRTLEGGICPECIRSFTGVASPVANPLPNESLTERITAAAPKATLLDNAVSPQIPEKKPLDEIPGPTDFQSQPTPAVGSLVTPDTPIQIFHDEQHAEPIAPQRKSSGIENLPAYEKLGSFYLGKKFEMLGRKLHDEKVLYDAKDLTKHAMCVGMTGCGKTGLYSALLEEAAIDGIPVIALDTKGDLASLLLAFPKLSGDDFKPWLERVDASGAGVTLEQLATQTAANWKSELESWDQDAARIARYRDAVDIAIYTPGSSAGIPLTVLRSFNAPSKVVIDDADVFRERIAGAAASLLTLMGIDAHPLNSREHILLSNIFDTVWRKGRNLDLSALIHAIQSPPMTKVGIFDIESFYPSAERMKLAMTLNHLLASPTFSGWLEGQQLDIKQLLYSSRGRPRLSIISIAHLSDSERMFFVTILLNELLCWMRTQPGTSSLRALFCMDDVYKYFPSGEKPPSKPSMLVLLKQAQASGLGIVLASQNSAALDYKGLSKIGTWFVGRLQTEGDRARVLEGLECVAAQFGKPFDRNPIEQTLASLPSRVFLMENAHDDGYSIFHSRSTLSFLREPLSRTQIQILMDPRRAELSGNEVVSESKAGGSTGALAATLTAAEPIHARPNLPKGIDERFCVPENNPHPNSKPMYVPAILAQAASHFVRAANKINYWDDISFLVTCERNVPVDLWKNAIRLQPNCMTVSKQPEGDFLFGQLSAELLNPKQYKNWAKDLAHHIYRYVPMKLFYSKEFDATSAPGESEMDTWIAWAQKFREKRDEAKAKLYDKYSKLMLELERKILAARQRVDRMNADYDKAKLDTALSFRNSILGALLRNKISPSPHDSRTSSAASRLGNATKERSEIENASSVLEGLLAEQVDLNCAFEKEAQELIDKFCVEKLSLEPLEIPCRKSDIKIALLCLLWIPYEVDSKGIATPLVRLTDMPTV